MKKILLSIFLLPFGLAAQVLSIGTPESVGVSKERLDRIDNMLKAAIDSNEIPGVVALIARKGKVIYSKALGMSQPNTPYKTTDIFRIASQTKAITCTAVMMLWEEGKFRLDDPISKYIPEFKEMQILSKFNPLDSGFVGTPAKKQITIRHLLTHTSGIGYGAIDDSTYRMMYHKAGIIDAFTTKPVLLKDNIKKLATMPLHFEPGTKWKYSESIDVLGYLVEVLSGKSLDVFFKERIFDPLQMTDTYFYLPDSKSSRLVDIKTKYENKWVSVSDSSFFNPNYPRTGAKTFFAGGAGLSSTALDYARFLQMYLNNGLYNGKRLLAPTTIKTIMANQIGDLWAGGNENHGLAFAVVNKKGDESGGLGNEGTFTWGGYFNTQYFADPKDQVIGIILKQTVNVRGDNTEWKFRQMVFQALSN